MTAQQASEAQCVENLQSEDVHPLEEAQAFASLIGQGYDVAAVAARLGKHPTFVAQRLRLIELNPSIAETFLEGKIPLAHATLIARLPAAQQPEAFTAAFRSVYLTGGQTSLVVPVKALAAWIEDNLLLDLDKVPFDKTDATLLADAGSCDQCPKRTGFNALLFPDAAADRCTDRNCVQEKIDRHILRQKERKPELVTISTAWGPKVNGALGRNDYTVVTAFPENKRKAAASNPAHRRCPHLTEALVTEGTDRGQTLTICANPKCEIHHAESRRVKEEQERTRVERDKEEQMRKIELTTRQRTLAAILNKIESPLNKANLQLIGRSFLGHLPQECRTALAKRHKADASKFAQEATASGDESSLCRLLVEMALIQPAMNAYLKEGGALIQSVAKRLRVPIERIAKDAAAEFAARRKKGNEQTSTPKRGKKKPTK